VVPKAVSTKRGSRLGLAHFGSLPPVRDLVVVYLLSTEGPSSSGSLYGALRLEPEEIRHQGLVSLGQDRVRGCGIPCPEWWTLDSSLGSSLQRGDPQCWSRGGRHALLLLGWMAFTSLISW